MGEVSCESKESMHYQRYDHSMCFLDDRYLFVTGSYIRELQVFKTVERYDIVKDRFSKFPSLNVGRCMHSSCSFDGQYIFVLCGLVINVTEYAEFSVEDGMTIIKDRVTW